MFGTFKPLPAYINELSPIQKSMAQSEWRHIQRLPTFEQHQEVQKFNNKYQAMFQSMVAPVHTKPMTVNSYLQVAKQPAYSTKPAMRPPATLFQKDTRTAVPIQNILPIMQTRPLQVATENKMKIGLLGWAGIGIGVLVLGSALMKSKKK